MGSSGSEQLKDVTVAELAAQLRGGESVEVVASGQQEGVGDLLKLALALDGADHDPAAVCVEAEGMSGRPVDLRANPHAHGHPRPPEGRGDVAPPRMAADDEHRPTSYVGCPSSRQ